MKSPVPYSVDLEAPEDDEAVSIGSIQSSLTEIMEITEKDEGHAIRSVHAKSHGIVSGTLTVLDDLPAEYAQGLFATPGEHPFLLRISTNPGDILDDSISLPRGIGLKVLEVEGQRLEGSEGLATQDFLMVNGPAFSARSVSAFASNLKLLAKTTDRAEWAKKALSTLLRTAESALEAVGTESATLKTMGGAANVHPLGETYWTQTAFRHGDFVAKYQLVPVSSTLTRHTGEVIDTKGRPDALREATDEGTREGPMTWEMRAQLLRDPEAMPVEDPTVEWDEADSPFVVVARLTAPAQAGWSEARARPVDDGMRFSPWTGIEAHRPLGAINRARRTTYSISAAFRERANRCPVREPQAADLPR